jgi:hypothetical protein
MLKKKTTNTPEAPSASQVTTLPISSGKASTISLVDVSRAIQDGFYSLLVLI